MAASSKSRGLASFGKQFFSQIRNGSSPIPTQFPSLALRRAVHTSVYDKNPDDQVRPTVVPDNIIQLQSDKYWAPHPQTGVFGPATTDHNQGTGGERCFYSSTANAGDQDSVLNQKAFFRHLENLEKPSYP